MLRIERILCPTDFSDFSIRAYQYAESLARHYGAHLYLEHVVQPLASSYPYYAFPDAWNDIYWKVDATAQQQLRDMVQANRWNGIQPEMVVHKGLVPETIVTFAKNQAVDLIVMGTHGRQGLDRIAMGSVTEKVLRKSHCPVLVVRRPVHDFVTPDKTKDPVQINKLLFCTDFSANSDQALSYAFSLAMEYNAELTLLHVLEDLPGSKDPGQAMIEYTAELEKMIPGQVRDWCTVKTAVRIGKPYQEIIQLGLESRSDLIIMDVHGRGILDRALFGSTTQRVIQLGSCPVLAVHL
jgi:nucleotide-binding universal stress UspA family protein